MAVRPWQIGEEQETSPGVYAMLVTDVDGWRLWRFENENGRIYTAARGSGGRFAPDPLGVGFALFAQAPWIQVWFKPQVRASIVGSHLHRVKVEMRSVGDRFMKSVADGFDPVPLIGAEIEVSISTMPGPRSFAKMATDHAVINMRGLDRIIDAWEESGGM